MVFFLFSFSLPEGPGDRNAERAFSPRGGGGIRRRGGGGVWRPGGRWPPGLPNKSQGSGPLAPAPGFPGALRPAAAPPRAAGCTQRKRVNPKEPVANQEGSSLEIGQDLLRVGIGLDLWQHLFHHTLLVNDISGAHHSHAGFAVELLFLPHAVSFNGLALRVC